MVLFWKIAAKPGRPLAFERIVSGDRSAVLFGLPGNPVAVMVTFTSSCVTLCIATGVHTAVTGSAAAATCVSGLKKARRGVRIQRGVLFQQDGSWHVRLTGSQGLRRPLRSMSEANCFIVLEHDAATRKWATRCRCN
ncbi:MAG: hypothetical protein IPH26_22970 [Sterolibacteriaceae bacterium]|uniref:Molybdopterin molybdenumtransferase n=1 Tax=Candidatus Methylophosphatis roskildensis TaxID=2899263 RepID=A0A9D7E882_9PROT|nr:hypothetical protein [Candidatus Methylophosphatis roskildensis]